MEKKSQTTAGKKPSTISKLNLEDVLESSDTSSDDGTIGSFARQPQSSLASSRRDFLDERRDQDPYDRKTSYADQKQWNDDDDSDDDDPQMKQIQQKARDKVQNQKDRFEEEKKEMPQPAKQAPAQKDALQIVEELLKPKPQTSNNRGSTIVSGNFKSGVIQAGFNQRSTAQIGRMSTVVHTMKRFQTVEDALDDSDSDDNFDEKIQPLRRQQSNQLQDFQRLGTRQLDPRQEPPTERLQVDILQIIEQNEKKNEPLLEQIVNQEAQLLSCDQEHAEQKKEIIKFDQLGLLSAHIHDEKQKYAGFVTCAATYSKYLFIGNIKGYIRVFDLESAKIADLRPLYDAQLAGNRVMCISLTPGMQYLISGYKSGAIAVWDLQKYKLEKLITDVHSSEIMGAKIFHITDENVINIISAEVRGPVRLIEISSKSFFGGLNHSKVEIYQQRLKTVTGVQIHQPTERQKQTYWGSKSLVVIGAVSEVVVCTMRPICEVFKIKRPQICKSKSIPYFDFGYGLTPEKQDATVLILAIAWDQIIQLIYFEEGREHKIRMDGIYYTDSEISSCYFTGESILVILQNQKAVKMLYTKKFHHGDYNLLGQQDGQLFDAESNRRQIREVTKFAEIERGQDEKKQIKWPRSQLIEEVDGQKYLNFHQTVVRFKRHIFYICDRNEQITRTCVLTYQEYLDRLRQQSKTWLYLLKSTLEIFSGELKGLSNVPDEKNAREREMMSFMKRHLLESLQSALPQQSSSNILDEKKQLVSNQMETIAIRAAIEFCLNLQEFDFLFEDVCDYFTDRNLQDHFVRGLEQFVLSGKLRQVKLPQIIIRTMIHECEKSEKFQQLERLIQQLDLTDYAFIDDLETLCQSQFMVSALLYILMTQNRDQSGTKSCINILNSMYKIMIQAQNHEKKEEQKKRGQLKIPIRPIDMTAEKQIEEDKKLLLEQQAIRKRKIQDLERLLGQISAEDKFDLEKSHVYIGYKFLWIIQMFLKGKKFPYGDMTEEQWRQHVIDIVNFITTEEYLKEILEFDPEMFFRVISRLFRGRPWQFLSEAQVNSQDCSFDPDDILRIIETRCNKTKRMKNDPSIINSFYVFILHVTIAQNEEIKKGATDKPVAFGVRSPKTMHMDYGMVYTAIESQLLAKPLGVSSLQTNQIDETLVIGALRAKQLKKEDIDKLHAIIKPQPETPAFINIKLELHESRKEYVDAFNYLLKSKTQQMRVFDWLDQILTNLQDDDATQSDFVSLKSAARLNMRDIIQLEVNDHVAKAELKQNNLVSKLGEKKDEEAFQTQRSLELINKWFDGDQQFLYKLASEDLASQPQTQYQFLRTFISLKEKQISDTIRESIFQPERQKQADLYNKMLIIFTRRLFENADSSVAVIWVSKDYFPTRECLEICRFFENFMAEAVLMEKLGDGMQAIKIYLKAIEKIDVKRISDQIRLVINNDWNVGRVGKFDQLLHFDQILDLACQIASKKEGDGGQLKYGEEGWFQILEFLQQLLIQSSANIEKFEEKINRFSNRTSVVDPIDFQDNRFSNRNTTRISDSPFTEIQLRVKQLKEFIMARISYILQRDDNHLSLRRVAERLGLQFEQVKKLCGDKLELLKGNARRENGCHKIFEHDNFYVFKQSEQFVTKGVCINAAFQQEKRIYQTQNRCRACKKPLLNSPSLLMIEAFACGHVFHAICLSGKSECSVCQKHQIPQYLDERKGQQEQNQEGRSVSDIAQSNKRMSQEQKNRATQRLLEMLDGNIESSKLNLTDFF